MYGGEQQQKNSLRHTCNNVYQANVCDAVPQRMEKEMEKEKIFEEIMAGNFPHLVKYINLYSIAQQLSNSISSKKTMPGYNTIKLLKIKEK